MSNQGHIDKFIVRQEKIDDSMLPPKDADALEAYINECRRNADELKFDLKYYVGNEGRQLATTPHLVTNNKSHIRTAAAMLTRAREDVFLKLAACRFQDDFKEKFDQLKAKYPAMAQEFQKLDLGSPASFHKSIADVTRKNNEDLVREIKELPYWHHVGPFLALEPGDYGRIKAEQNKSLEASLHNAPTVYLEDVESFITHTWEERHTAPYEECLYTLEFASGRRAIELLWQSKIELGMDDTHIKVTGLAKERTERELRVPVRFLSAIQFLKLYELTQKRFREIHTKLDPERFEKITKLPKAKQNRAISDLNGKARKNFRKVFPILRPNAVNGRTKHVGPHKITRSVYAQYAFRTLRDHPYYQHQADIVLAQAILGHASRRDTIHYLDVILIFHNAKSIKTEAKQISQEIKPASEAEPLEPKRSKPTPTDKKFFLRIAQPDVLIAIAKIPNKSRRDTLLHLHKTIRGSFKKIPTLDELQKIANAKALKQYAELLQKLGIAGL